MDLINIVMTNGDKATVEFDTDAEAAFQRANEASNPAGAPPLIDFVISEIEGWIAARVKTMVEQDKTAAKAKIDTMERAELQEFLNAEKKKG